MKSLSALVISVGIVLVSALLAHGQDLNFSTIVSVLVLSPGISVWSWFVPPAFVVSESVRLAIIACVSVVIYWPVVFFLLESLSDRRRIWDAITPGHVVWALAMGVIVSFVSFKLQSLSATTFGIFFVPSGFVCLPVVMIFGGTDWGRWTVTLMLLSGSLAYSLMAFLVLHKFVWAKSYQGGHQA